MDKYLEIANVVGLVVLALPALFGALVAIFKIIPGDQPDKILEVMASWMTKVAEVVAKLVKPKQ